MLKPTVDATPSNLETKEIFRPRSRASNEVLNSAKHRRFSSQASVPESKTKITLVSKLDQQSYCSYRSPRRDFFPRRRALTQSSRLTFVSRYVS